jgi:hypothetical protein
MLHTFFTNLNKVEKTDQHASHNVICSGTEEVARTPTKPWVSNMLLRFLVMRSHLIFLLLSACSLEIISQIS